MKGLFRIAFLLPLLVFALATPSRGAGVELNAFDREVKRIAEACRDEVVAQFDLLLTSGRLTMDALFDTFYVPIPDTYPQKFHTRYDRVADGVLQNILDRCLGQSRRFAFVVAVDRNGYLPTHNSRYSLPLTGDPEVDTRQNRTKRIFNDRTGLAAAHNIEPFLLQRYARDTGEMMSDLSVPIFVRSRHWGALRIGYE